MGNNDLLSNAVPATAISVGAETPTITAANGGKMQASQAARFIDLTVDSSTLIPMVRVMRPTNVAGEFGKLQFGTPVTEDASASEGQDSGHTVKPTHSKISYTTKKLRSALDITTEVYEENVEGQSYEDTLMGALARRMATDLEYLAIMGDDSDTSPYTVAEGGLTDAVIAKNRLLKANTGWYKQGLSGNIVDCGGAAITKTYFSQMIRALPQQYKQNRGDLRFFMSPSAVQDYRDWLTWRQTSLGDQSLVGSDALRVFGIPIVEVPLIPEDLTTDYHGSNVAAADGTFMWLTFPQNFIYIITRDIDLYWMYQPRKDMNEATLYTRTDFLVENTDAMVTGVDLTIAGAVTINPYAVSS